MAATVTAGTKDDEIDEILKDTNTLQGKKPRRCREC